MRVVWAAASATLLAAAVISPSGSPARASSDDPDLNGTYRATSDGQWATTNDQYHDEPTVTSIWTITTSCVNPMECTGQVTSDQGWSAPAQLVGGNMWRVTHDVPHWEPCANDLPAATGRQVFRFSIDKLVGDDHTTGPSGACGVNKWLVVDMPFKLVKIG